MLSRYRNDLALATRPVRLYLLGAALLGAANTVPWTQLALYLDRLGFGKQEIGLVQASGSWGKVLIAIPAAIYLARRPARGLLSGAAFGAGVAFALLPWMGELWAFCLCYFAAHLAMSVHMVAAAPFLFRHTSPIERPAMFGLASAAATLAAVVGAFAAGRFVTFATPLLSSETNALAWALTGGGMLAFAACFVYRGIDDEGASLTRGANPWSVLRQHRGVLLRFAAPQLAVASGAGFCIPFLSLYFQDRFQLGPGDWGTLFSAGQVLMSAGMLLTPFIVGRLGFVRSMITIELCSIPFFLLLAYAQVLPLAIMAFMLRAALMNSTHPILSNFMMQATPPEAREVQTGLNATVWGIGWVIGPLAAGRVLETTDSDYTILMLTTIGFYLLAALLTAWLLRPLDPVTSGTSR